MIPYMQGAQPYLLQGDSTGVLILHGLTASPAEPRWLGDHLHTAGYTVCGMRLAGHGTDHQALARVRWEDWAASAFDGYYLLKSICDRIVLIGHSMGGALAMALASDERIDLSALVLMATPASFDHPRVRMARWLQFVMPYTDQTDRSALPESIKSEQTRRGEPALGRVRYDLWATRGVAELVEMTDYAYQHLPNVIAPTLLVHSRKDSTIPYANMAKIQARIGAQTVETCTLENSGHIIPQDSERGTAFEVIAEFLHRQLTSETGAHA